MKILYAGDSPIEGPAQYLLAVLKKTRASVHHIPPGRVIRPSALRDRYDGFILSDFSKKHLPVSTENLLIRQIYRGAGLLMIGGWGSFSGPFGGWKDSEIEKLLPVRCLHQDDRMNFPGGALLEPTGKKHPILQTLMWNSPPAICGMNRIRVMPKGHVLLQARPVKKKGSSVCLANPYPLLIVNEGPDFRSAALTTDAAPHWSGGWVDWGSRIEKIKIHHSHMVQVGSDYVRLLSRLVRWICKRL